MEPEIRQRHEEKLKFYLDTHQIKKTWYSDRLIELWNILSLVQSTNLEGGNWESWHQKQSDLAIEARSILSKIFEIDPAEVKSLEIQKLRKENARLKSELEEVTRVKTE